MTREWCRTYNNKNQLSRVHHILSPTPILCTFCSMTSNCQDTRLQKITNAPDGSEWLWTLNCQRYMHPKCALNIYHCSNICPISIDDHPFQDITHFIIPQWLAHRATAFYCFRHQGSWDRRPFGPYFRSRLAILQCSKRQGPCLLQVVILIHHIVASSTVMSYMKELSAKWTLEPKFSSVSL